MHQRYVVVVIVIIINIDRFYIALISALELPDLTVIEFPI